MYERVVDAEPLERIHLYAVPEQDIIRERMNILRALYILLSVLLFSCLFTIPASADVSPYEITVPLEHLPTVKFSQSVQIQPTGEHRVPATFARGVLTLYNGSIFNESLPRGFILENDSGLQFVTEETAIVPGGNPTTGFGQASVHAHAVAAGHLGNIAPLAIDSIYGSSLHIKNLEPFTGGVDAYAVPVATEQDRLRAKDAAILALDTQAKSYSEAALPAKVEPSKDCGETVTEEDGSIVVTWSCEFVRYVVPDGLQVIEAKQVGDEVVLQVKR